MSQPPLEMARGAAREAREAREWYAEQSEEVSERFVAELDEAIEQIRLASRRWSKHLHGTRHYLLSSFPYAVIYRAHANRTEIVAVAHVRRRPGYWKGR